MPKHPLPADTPAVAPYLVVANPAALIAFLGLALMVPNLVALIGWQRTRAYARVIDASGPLPSLHVLDATSALVALLGVGLAVYIMVL